MTGFHADARHRLCSLSGPRKAGLFVLRFPRRGVRNAGRFTAPAAPGVPTRNRHTRRPVPKHRAAAARKSKRRGHLQFTPLEGSPPRKQVLRLRSARGWTLRLAACPGTRCFCPAFPFVRTVARTCTWAVRPFCRSFPPIRPFRRTTVRRPASWRPPQPAPRHETLMRRPLPERDGGS